MTGPTVNGFHDRLFYSVIFEWFIWLQNSSGHTVTEAPCMLHGSHTSTWFTMHASCFRASDPHALFWCCFEAKNSFLKFVCKTLRRDIAWPLRATLSPFSLLGTSSEPLVSLFGRCLAQFWLHFCPSLPLASPGLSWPLMASHGLSRRLLASPGLPWFGRCGRFGRLWRFGRLGRFGRFGRFRVMRPKYRK